MKARIPNQPNRGDMMKMVQEMQENMARVTEEVENTEFVTSVGGGAVEANTSLFLSQSNPKLLIPTMLKCLRIS